MRQSMNWHIIEILLKAIQAVQRILKSCPPIIWAKKQNTKYTKCNKTSKPGIQKRHRVIFHYRDTSYRLY